MLPLVGVSYVTLRYVSLLVPSVSISVCGRIARAPCLELEVSNEPWTSLLILFHLAPDGFFCPTG